MSVACSVGSLTHFPVKSTGGQPLSTADIDERGLVHDRQWAVYTADGGIASGKTTRRFRKVDGLLKWFSSASATPGPPWLHSPTGDNYRVDDPAAASALSEAFGQPMTLRRETDIRHHDESGVHLITMSSVRRIEHVLGSRIDARRLRANIVLETEGTGFREDGWSGATLTIGPDVVLRLGPGMPRCVMIDQPQAQLRPGPPMLRALGRVHDVLFGLQAHVIRPGTIARGDRALLRLDA